MCNMTKDVTFSHKVARDAVTKVANPAKDTKGRVICAIKCNLEADTLSVSCLSFSFSNDY